MRRGEAAPQPYAALMRLLHQTIREYKKRHSGSERCSVCPVLCPGSGEGTRAQAFLRSGSLPLAQHPPSHQGREQGHPCLVFLVGDSVSNCLCFKDSGETLQIVQTRITKTIQGWKN